MSSLIQSPQDFLWMQKGNSDQRFVSAGVDINIATEL